MAEMAGIYQDYGGGPQAITDLNKLSEMGARQQQAAQESALLPGRLRLQETLSAQQAANALQDTATYRKIMQELSQDQMMGNLIKKYSTEGLTLGESLEKASEAARTAGLWKPSIEAGKAASIQYSHENTALKTQLEAMEQEHKNNQVEYQRFAAEAGQVRTQEDFDDFNANAALKMGRPVPWPRELNPETLEKIRDFARDQRGRDEIKEKAQERMLRQKLADQANRARVVAAGITARQREAAGAARQTRVYEPTKAQIGVVERLVERDNPEAVGAGEVEAFSRGIAHEARKRALASNGEVTFDEAAEEVYDERKDMLKVIPPEESGFKLPQFLGGGKPTPPKFEYQTPRSPGGKLNPIPLTLDAQGQFSVPKDKRVNGKWYNLGRNSGGIRRWVVEDGKGGWEDLY